MDVTKRQAAIEIFLFLLCLFGVWSLRATLFYSIDESIPSDSGRIVYSTLIKLGLWIVPAFGFVVWVRHAEPFQYLGLSVMPSIRQWVAYLVMTGVYLGAIIGFETLLGQKVLTLAGFSFPLTLANLLFTFVSPFIEEILFRGLILKELSRLLPNWGANLLTSLLFVGIHLPFWLSHGGVTQAMVANSVGVFIFSGVAGWLYQHSASVWPPTLAHIANNFISGLLIVRG